MTPPAVQLQFHLDQRCRWFQSWLFKWHHIGRDRPVEIDMFDGQAAHLSGIAFDGSARLTYWDAVVRGVRKEVMERLAWIDNEVRRYNPETAETAIGECAGLLAAFVRTVRRSAVAKDRILRGDGINFPPLHDAGRWEGLSAEEIAHLAERLKASLPRTDDGGGASPSALSPVALSKVSPVVRHIDLPEEHLQFWLDHHGDLARRELRAEIVSINAEMSKRGLLHSGMRIRRIAQAGAELLNRCTDAALVKARAEAGVPNRCDLVADSLFRLVEHVRARVDAEVTRSGLGPLDQKVREAGDKLVDQIALDLKAAIRLARPALTSPAVKGTMSGPNGKPEPAHKLKRAPRPDPNWEWAIGEVTSEVLRAGYSKPLPRGGRAAIETMLLARMAARDRHVSGDSARRYASRVIDALPERAT